MKRFIALAVVLVALVALPVYAQQSGLTLEGVSSRIDVLFSGQTYLTQRIAALETTVAISSQRQVVALPTMTPVPTLPPPTSTFTPSPTNTPIPSSTPSPEPTETLTPSPSPTHATARVVAIRRQTLRRGPGINHAIIETVNTGDEFIVLGKNLNGTWWQISYEGRPAWISTAYVDEFNTDAVRIAPTPTSLPSPTVRATKTPIPTATMEKMSNVDQELVLISVKKDMEGSGQNPENESFEQLQIWVNERIHKVNVASKKCGLSIEELFEMIEPHALRLEENGLAAEKEWWVRWSFLGIIAEREEGRSGSCNWYLEGYVEWLLDQEEEK